MTDEVLVIENPQLLDALKASPEKVKPYLTDAMQDILFMIQAALGYASYPPATEANLPGRLDRDGNPMGYYERGRGWWYPVMQSKTLAGIDSVKEGAQTIQSAYRRHKISTKKIKTTSNLEVVPGKIVREMPGGKVYQEVSVVERRTPIVAGYKLAKNKHGHPGTSELLGKSWTTQMTTTEDSVQGEVGTPVSYADNVQGFNIPQYHLDRGWLSMDDRLEGLMPDIEQRVDQGLADYLERFGE